MIVERRAANVILQAPRTSDPHLDIEAVARQPDENAEPRDDLVDHLSAREKDDHASTAADSAISDASREVEIAHDRPDDLVLEQLELLRIRSGLRSVAEQHEIATP